MEDYGFISHNRCVIHNIVRNAIIQFLQTADTTQCDDVVGSEYAIERSLPLQKLIDCGFAGVRNVLVSTTGFSSY